MPTGRIREWKRANPNLGVSVKMDFLEREFLRAKKNAALENDFKRLYLNIRTRQTVTLIPMDQWDAPCEFEMPDEEELRTLPCYMGLDLSARRDFTAAVLAWRYGSGYVCRPYLWLPEDRALERRELGTPALEWERDGYLELCPGGDIDYDAVEAKILELTETYPVQEIAFDQWNCEAIAQRLDKHHGLRMVRFRQGTAYMNEPTQLLVSLVAERQLAHGGHPVLRWMASNVAGEIDKDQRIRPSKTLRG